MIFNNVLIFYEWFGGELDALDPGHVGTQPVIFWQYKLMGIDGMDICRLLVRGP